MSTEAQKRASMKYNRASTILVPFRLNKATDADILARLKEVPSKQGYIKSLIRADIEREKNTAVN